MRARDDDDRYVPEGDWHKYVLADHPPPQIARCNIAVYWIEED